MNWGDETLVFLEIDQPLCSLTYGEGACQAVLGVTGARKCYNSRATCQDAANYAPGTLTLRFGRPQLDLLQYGNVIPALQSYSFSPMAINLGGMDENLSAFGRRETVTVILQDHQWDDHLVDKYRLERAFVEGQYTQTFTPRMFRRPFGAPEIARNEFFGYLDAALEPYKRGTFWGKWLARNPYHQGSYVARIRIGTLGQALSEMRVRNYVVDRIEGPSEGQVRVVLKDLFSLVEARKAVAPLASLGELDANITDVATSATLSPAGIGNAEYPASGHVAIGDEVMAFTRSGDALMLTRGQFNTVAAAHDAEDLVQLVASFSAELVQDILYDLLTVYAAIPAAQIDKPTWDARAAQLTELYTARITTPTPVAELAGELMLQAGCTIWPDPATGMIEFRALQAGVVSQVVNDQAWIAEGRALAVKRQDAKRVSQFWVYYGQIKPNEPLDDRRNYRSRSVSVDLAAEGTQQYGVPVIREVFSRWIPQFGRASAERCGERLIAMFRDAPLEATIPLHASRDGQLHLAEYFSLQTADVQDETGGKSLVTMAPIEIEPGESEIEIKAQQVTFGTLEVGGERVITIENDSYNLNLRDLHDSLYAAPTGSEVIRFVLSAGVTVGSTSSGSPAIRTGEWPAMSTAPTLVNLGRIQGKGGKGGDGQYAYDGPNCSGSPASAEVGEIGGTALLAEAPLDVDNTDGELWAGGSGGGGTSATNDFGNCYAGGGGGGAGTNPGAGGIGTLNLILSYNGSPGSIEAGGAGFYTGFDTAGDGGGPGLAGSAATSGAAGGAPGKYAEGNTFITWLGTGDRRGGVS